MCSLSDFCLLCCLLGRRFSRARNNHLGRCIYTHPCTHTRVHTHTHTHTHAHTHTQTHTHTHHISVTSWSNPCLLAWSVYLLIWLQDTESAQVAPEGLTTSRRQWRSLRHVPPPPRHAALGWENLAHSLHPAPLAVTVSCEGVCLRLLLVCGVCIVGFS